MGKIVGIALRDGRLGRCVEVRSRERSCAKVRSVAVVERVVKGFERRMRVVRLGVLLRNIMSWRLLMLQEVRSSLVRVAIIRAEQGFDGVPSGLKARDRVSSLGNRS